MEQSLFTIGGWCTPEYLVHSEYAPLGNLEDCQKFLDSDFSVTSSAYYKHGF